ncbi:glycerophosphodiester phosphodiesterase family protein [Pleionea litopenaei]|uniref:glycerophosphodiester phosphodiesterase n=1 Tax=Pleionea litopenaei TaxID=3070815 RepID=A0AA51RW68_9GAMM|nr:glycerophosphodiester phosphodiesterase family protein [Pleionea sp. HL-JVS1]WMS88625.1 glycerophosphodiester phosphodiesterase family protein [Pleionea sp. HL-JVS1]
MKLTTSLCVVAMSLSIGVDAAKYQVNDAALSNQVDEKHASRGLSRYQNELGPRPFYLLDDMDDGALKSALKRCENRLFFKKTDFSIGHRGAPMQFPEHTKESYMAAAKMGAGVIECDVTFTKDKQLVCRHSQCDLHTTTNILGIPELASKCSQPFVPANAATSTPATAQCCTSDITLAEFKSLCGKMDASDPTATTAEQYMQGTANWRTDLYSQCGTLLTHAESIQLFNKLGVKMTPELKAPSVSMPFEGDYSQQDYAQQMIDEYKAAGVSPKRVLPQSFNLSDVEYWVEHEPRFARQAVYLDDRMYTQADYVPSLSDMMSLREKGVRVIAPPMWALLTLDEEQQLVASDYAKYARQAGLKIITWTLERDGPLKAGGGWYHQSISEAINNDGDTYQVLDALAKKVGVIGVFSDWPATTSYYANCMNLD